jgi:acyl-coenzyme A synthetase/AMP-(fatty) acid ligase
VRYNIGVHVIDKHVAAGQGDRLALVHELASGAFERLSFNDTAPKSIGHPLVAHGIRRGDPVAILFPQRQETATSHVPYIKRA